MKYFSSILLLLVILSSCQVKKTRTFTEDEISIVPKPSSLYLSEGSYTFSKDTKISVADDSQKPAAKYLSDLFEKAAGFPLNIIDTKDENGVVFIEDETLASETYTLEVTPKSITIKASDAAGYFYAVQTIRQLLPASIEKADSNATDWVIPSINITDQPRFAWRGMQMDFSRHFFSMDEVKTFLDYMALYKLNTYHMHLTDDQGWRVEIKKYPLLTEKGAWRIESSHDIECKKLAKTDPSFTIDEQHYHDRDGQRMYGGFYTQEQIKEIIAYAAERQIEVIPEIDMPGHFKSAIDNYPFLACTGEAGWGELFSSPACLGKESTYEFTKNILSEIAELFPSEYIHIGGDEVNIQSWKECPLCQKAIKDNNLKNEHELQSFFNHNIEAFLKSKGKRMMGWDEIVEGGVSDQTTMMWWRNWAPDMLTKAADNGNDIVMTPCFEYYFDAKHEVTPFEKVYNYEPIPETFNEGQAKHIIGIQANLWSEMIPNFKRLEYQAFPRLLAMAETAWSSKDAKDHDNFQKRMTLQYDRLDALGVQYHIPAVTGLKDKVAFLDTATITLEAPLHGMEIYYTTDGSIPTKASKKYTEPLSFSETVTLNTVAYRGDIASEKRSALVEKQSYLEPLEVTPEKGAINRWAAVKKFKVVDDIVMPKSATYIVVNELNFTDHDGQENVSMVFKGYFYAEADGLYEFATKSDDGSLLYIGDKFVVDNGGNHSALEKNGMVALKKGWHPLTVKFHEATGGGQLTVWYTAPNGDKKILNGDVIGK
ncbi:family 20 glycosylhydrolase [Gelidibacter salicanalis]|uniref:beta-N-acetylhexosaminidase n=1 Tax=Gelidibacter salicanalis TaxID=291193 RepID=A0A5C7AK44_9FLAO|nr:family 20 glycosylhydrolase [Gelidibacter salicanalis]TXE09140.1 family 20 glycosylhydrolase [Gelidibacter salicanalis]